MASPTQLVQFTFAGGIDQAVRGEVLDPSNAFTLIQNARQNERGGLGKRLGLLSMTTTRMDDTTISAGSRLFSNGKRACLADGTYLNEYSPTAARWVSRGRLPEAALSMVGLPGVGGSSSTSTVSDAVVCGNYIVAIFTGTTGSYATVLDAKTRSVVRAAELVTSATDYVMLATYDTTVVAVFSRPNSGTIRYQYISLANVSAINTGWSSTATVASDGHPTMTSIAMSVCSLSDRVVVAYINSNTGTTNRVNVKTFTAGGVIDSATLTTGNVVVAFVAIAPDEAGGLLAAWNETTDVKVCTLSSALSVTGSAAILLSSYSPTLGVSTLHALDVCGSGTSGAGKLFANYDSDTSGAQLDVCAFTVSAGAVNASGSIRSMYNVRRIGRAFRSGTRYYALCRGYDVLQRESFVCDLTGDTAYARPVANIRPNLATSRPYSQASLYGSTRFLPITTRTTGSTYAGELAALDFSSTQRWQPAQFGASTFLSGSLVAQYDGQRVFESGFVVHPPAPTGVDSGVAGNPNGTYRYALVYEHVDANGNWHTSGVSLPSSIVTVASKQVTVTVRNLGVTARSIVASTATSDGTIRVSLYRTVTGGEPPYYYLGSVDNALNAATQTYTDDSADATIAANAKLYAPSLPGVNGSSQDHRAPPGLLHLKAGNGVLVGAIGEVLWHSSQDVDGEGLWWSPVFSGPVSGDGDITGIEYQDGTFYVFKRRAIYAITCEPPSDNGASGGLGTSRRLAVDVGCIDNRSLCVTSLGIFFQSERGIEILTRAQGVEWIGEQIQDSLGPSSTVVGATLDATTGLMYFELYGASAALVYDINRRIWQSVDTRGDQGAGGAVIWDESQSSYRYACLTSGGLVRVEQSASWLDESSTWITMSATTGWVKLGGIQGQQIVNRALVLAKKSTRADLSVSLAYDYSDSFKAATVYTADALDALTTSLNRIQVQHAAHDDAEGQSIRATVSDATPTGGTVTTGHGATWVALTFEGQPRSNAALVSEEAA